MKLQSYKELIVWQKSTRLAIDVYKVTGQYPKNELYGLTSQTRKSAISIPSNIAEGSTRQHLLEYLQFLNIALGSAAELETQLFIAKELKFLEESDYKKLNDSLIEIMKMLNGLMKNLRPNT